MATAVGAGFDISKLLDSITKADEALTNLMNKNKQASRSIITSFQQIANQGVVPYTQSLEKSLSIYNSIRDAITDTSGKAKRGFGDMKSEIDKVITATETLMTSLSRSPQFKYELQVKATRDYRDQMVRIYTEMFDTIEKRTTQNQSAKNNSQAYAQNYQQQLSAYERLFDEAIAREDKKKKEQADRDAKREAEEHKRKIDNINKRFDLIERRNKRYAQRQTEYLNSPKGALEYARGLDTGVKSIKTMNQALQQLRNAQANVNTNTEEGRKKYNELGVAIKRVETEMRAVSGASDEVKKKHSKLMDTSGQLMRAMTAIFSVSAIKGYINKLREVRGEFEMQQRSLQILLQNKDKADELWEKTIDLAVKSPFRVKELVTYTKQLAAYRVESDKLYDTTKMLADVSAGLGVDMNRLILAFGQVKAANFLRGTELRQFTEAGIPMLDELAKLFTELEGRAVSAGDVFERISKRMVTFGDVEEVFNRITSAGGVFYNMQEEQSKTLAGLYSNLHDSIDLMLNDIGKANEGILKGSMNVAKDFVENWREIADIMKAWGIALSPLIARTILFKAANTGLSTSLVTLFTNTDKGLAISMSYGRWLSKLSRQSRTTALAVKGLGKAMAGLSTIGVSAVIAGTVALITKLYSEMTRASREAKRLEKDLNAIFNEDASNLERQTETFKDLVERLKDVNKGSKEHKNIISQLNNQYGEYLGFIVDEKTTYDQLASSINSVTTALTQKAKAASYEKALARVYESTNKEIEKSTQIIEDVFSKGFARQGSDTKLMPTQKEINDIFNLIEKKVVETGDVLTQGLDINDILSEYYGEEVSVQNPIASVYLDLSKSILKQKKAELDIQSKINTLYGEGVYSTKEYRDEMEKLKKAKEEELSNEKSRSGKDKIEYKYKVEEVRLQGRYEGLDDSAIQKRVDRIQKVSATVADINRRMGKEADKFGQDAIDRVYITFQDASQGVDAIAEQTAASYKSMQKEIKDQNALKEAGTIHDQEALDNATLMSQVYYRMLEIMGKTDLIKEEDKKKNKKSIDILKNRISLIKEMYQEYQKVNKEASSEEAAREVANAYKDTFLEAFEGTGINLSGLVVNKDKLKELQDAGSASGSAFSEAMISEMNKIAEEGVYIRKATEDIIDDLKVEEGWMNKAYQDVGGIWTIGAGSTRRKDGSKIKEGDYWTDEEIWENSQKQIKEHEDRLNAVLDKHRDILLTQQQYNVLLKATWQGGGTDVIPMAKSADLFKKRLEEIDEMPIVKVLMGKDGKVKERTQVGIFDIDIDAIMKEYESLESVYDRMALVLKYIGNRAARTKDTTESMLERAEKRSADFAGNLEVVKLLHKASIDVSQIDFTNIKGVIAILKQLGPIAEKEGKEAELALYRAISELEAEIKIKPLIEEREALERQISDIFSNYEISLEMDKLNIPPDLAEQLFGFESIDLNEIRGKVLEKFGLGSMVGTSNQGIYDSAQFKAMSKERQDELRKSLEKESELQDNALKERLKTYTQYLKKEQDERIKLKLEELRKIHEVESMSEYSPEQKKTITDKIKDDTQKELMKLKWRDFETSSIFLNIFEDLEKSTPQALRNMSVQLDSLRESMIAAGLPASDLKEILDKINQVEEELERRSPFKSFFENLGTSANIKDFKIALADEERLIKERDELKKAENEALINVETTKVALQVEEDRLASMSKGTDEYESQRQKVELQRQALTAAIGLHNGILASQRQNNKQLDETQQKIKNWKDVCLDIAESFNEIGNAVNQVGGALGTTLEQLGLMSEETKAIYDSSMNIANDAFNLGGNIMQLVANPTNPQAWVGAITNAISLIGNIAATGDAVREKEIQAEMKKVDRLEKAYEKLEKEMDKAYTSAQMSANKASIEQNIDAQIKALESANAKEEAMKKKDQDQIDANYEKIAELEEKKAELQRETVERLGGTYDYASVAEQFLDAWLEAFKETGDGLSGLEDNFDEFFSYLAKKQIVYGGLTTIIENLQKKINADLADNQRIDNWDDIIKEYNKTITRIDEFLTGAVSNLESAGLDIFSGDGGELSGLSKGIQGMSEETSNILAAYWNAVRFDVSAIRQRFDEYLATQGISEDANPMMTVLNSQLEQLKAIRGVLDDAITGGDSTTGAFRVRVVEMN